MSAVKTYLDLDTIENHNGFIKNLEVMCKEQLVFVDITDTDTLFHLYVNEEWLYFTADKEYRRIKFREETKDISSPEGAVEFIAATIEKLRK